MTPPDTADYRMHSHPPTTLWSRDCPVCVTLDPDGSIAVAGFVPVADIEVSANDGTRTP
jgi:hypothetical protein